ncbi:hypothetical protein GQ53DRAFT_811420 [Thozetella sp. PMI_491]|nr:hypothetical protein GQ53DRAFT_811420 [Thozetella sp. PMI_491]
MAAMEIGTDDDILRRVASDGTMDYSSWPALLPTVVSRIEETARNDFRIPIFPPPQPAVRPPSPRFLAPLPSSDPIEPPESEGTSSQETNKENANPSSSTTTNAHALGAAQAASLGSSAPSLPPIEPGALPPPIAALLDEITSTITGNFQTYPPHTIQRLAELVLNPKQHYRNLPAYLHALDRVVHVTSGANLYPLPPAIPDPTAMSRLANGHGGGGTSSGLSINSAAANNIGSDEALGGALLTPIPWLARRANGDDGSSDVGSSSPMSAGPSPTQAQQPSPTQGRGSQQRQGSNGDRQMETESTETIEGPNGMGRIETVSVSITNGIPSMTAISRGITQGELLRQEQRAGVVPVSQLARHGHSGAPGHSAGPGTGAGPSASAEPGNSTGAAAPSAEDEDAAMGDDPEEEIPHARGPEEIGAADTGPQNPNSTFHANAGGSIEMQGIDVEAAVGRPGEGTHTSPEPTVVVGHAGSELDTVVPKSPKREAADDVEAGARKRVKDGGSEEAEETLDEKAALKQDAEGDVIIEDSVAEADTSAAGPRLVDSGEGVSKTAGQVSGGGDVAGDEGHGADPANDGGAA